MIKKGVLKKDTYFYFVAEPEPEQPLTYLLDGKITSWNSYLLQRIKIPKGSPVIANSHILYVFCDNATITVFKLNGRYFFKISHNGKESFPRMIILPNGPPPPYPLSLLS